LNVELEFEELELAFPESEMVAVRSA